ncbi:hypothetical protein MMPV_002737 [Pyropia vietnamensis]
MTPVLILAGPTGVGKSALAMELASRLGGELIAADSVTAYTHFSIGSAKPSPADRAAVPHHLLDMASGADAEPLDAGAFYAAAIAAIDDCLDRGVVPIVVGGTSMYVRWLVRGVVGAPRASADVRAAVAAELEGRTWSDGLALLAAADPVRAAELVTGDWYRLSRALEVVRATGGVGMGALPQVGAEPDRRRGRGAPTAGETDGADTADGARHHPVHAIGNRIDVATTSNSGDNGVADTVAAGHEDLTRPAADSPSARYDWRCFFLTRPRADLFRRVDARCVTLIRGVGAAGAVVGPDGVSSVDNVVDEVAGLLKAGLLVPGTPPARAIGYRQTASYLAARAAAAAGAADGGPPPLPYAPLGRVKAGTVAAEPAVAAFRAYLSRYAAASRQYTIRQLKWFRKEPAFAWLPVDGHGTEDGQDRGDGVGGGGGESAAAAVAAAWALPEAAHLAARTAAWTAPPSAATGGGSSEDGGGGPGVDGGGGGADAAAVAAFHAQANGMKRYVPDWGALAPGGAGEAAAVAAAEAAAAQLVADLGGDAVRALWEALHAEGE